MTVENGSVWMATLKALVGLAVVCAVAVVVSQVVQNAELRAGLLGNLGETVGVALLALAKILWDRWVVPRWERFVARVRAWWSYWIGSAMAMNESPIS